MALAATNSLLQVFHRATIFESLRISSTTKTTTTSTNSKTKMAIIAAAEGPVYHTPPKSPKKDIDDSPSLKSSNAKKRDVDTALPGSPESPSKRRSPSPSAEEAGLPNTDAAVSSGSPKRDIDTALPGSPQSSPKRRSPSPPVSDETGQSTARVTEATTSGPEILEQEAQDPNVLEVITKAISSIKNNIASTLQPIIDDAAPSSNEDPTTQPPPNKKGHNVRWRPENEFEIKTIGEDSDNSDDDDEEEDEEEEKRDEALSNALESIPNLGCLPYETFRKVSKWLDRSDAQVLSRVGFAARQERLKAIEKEPEKKEPTDPRVAKGNSSREAAIDSLLPTSDQEHELRQTTYRALLTCLDHHIDSAIICTHCNALHTRNTSLSIQCPTLTEVTGSTSFAYNPDLDETLGPENTVFPHPITFGVIQLGMKYHRNERFNDFCMGMASVLKGEEPLQVEKKRRSKSKGKNKRKKAMKPVDVDNRQYRTDPIETEFWWGGFMSTAKVSVSTSSPSASASASTSSSSTPSSDKKEDKSERLMYRTQNLFLLSEKHRDNPSAHRSVEHEMNGMGLRKSVCGTMRGLCSHVDETFWRFEDDDAAKWKGVKRCGLCALEWEVSVGEVVSVRREDAMQREKKGLLVGLTCWRDLGVVRSVRDPRWKAHFPEEYDEDEDSDEEESDGEEKNDEKEKYDENWLKEFEEPAQDWELGGIKRAYESVGGYAGEGENGEGDLKWNLEERGGKKLKRMLGWKKGMKVWAEMEVKVRF